MSQEIGTLVVVVLKARNLNDKHRLYKQDAYGVISLNGTKKSTKIDVKGGQHPVWDEEIRLPVLREGSEKFRSLKVSCWSKESRVDDKLGEGRVDISDTLKTGEFDDWVQLEVDGVARGELYLEMTYYATGPAPLSRRQTKMPQRERLERPATQVPRTSTRPSPASPLRRDSPLPAVPGPQPAPVPSILRPGAATTRRSSSPSPPPPASYAPFRSESQPLSFPVPTVSYEPPPAQYTYTRPTATATPAPYEYTPHNSTPAPYQGLYSAPPAPYEYARPAATPPQVQPPPDSDPSQDLPDPYLIARYKTPLPLPPSPPRPSSHLAPLYTKPAPPAPAVSNHVPKPEPHRAPKQEPDPVDLVRAERERKRAQEEADLELARRLDRELNL